MDPCLSVTGKKRGLAGKSFLWRGAYHAWEQCWRPAPLLDLLNHDEHLACVGNNQSIGHFPKTFFF